MVAMVFGACYTAMPLTLVGGQFYACYQEHISAVHDDDDDRIHKADSLKTPQPTYIDLHYSEEEVKGLQEYREMSFRLLELENLHLSSDLPLTKLKEHVDQFRPLIKHCLVRKQRSLFFSI